MEGDDTTYMDEFKELVGYFLDRTNNMNPDTKKKVHWELLSREPRLEIFIVPGPDLLEDDYDELFCLFLEMERDGRLNDLKRTFFQLLKMIPLSDVLFEEELGRLNQLSKLMQLARKIVEPQ